MHAHACTDTTDALGPCFAPIPSLFLLHTLTRTCCAVPFPSLFTSLPALFPARLLVLKLVLLLLRLIEEEVLAAQQQQHYHLRPASDAAAAAPAATTMTSSSPQLLEEFLPALQRISKLRGRPYAAIALKARRHVPTDGSFSHSALISGSPSGCLLFSCLVCLCFFLAVVVVLPQLIFTQPVAHTCSRCLFLLQPFSLTRSACPASASIFPGALAKFLD